MEACSVCRASLYKIRRDNLGDVEGDGECPRKRIPTKVMWYAPIIPRLKHLFRNKDHATLLRWHKEDRKVDNMLRYPADGSQWRVGMKTVRIFSDRIRNRIRLEGLRSVHIRVRISNIRYCIRIRILKSHIYDVDIQSYPIRHS